MPLPILIALEHEELRETLAEQLSIDGHDVHAAQHARHAAALLAGREISVMILGALETGPASLKLLRELRAGALDAHVWPELPVITLAPLAGTDSELDAVRAYQAGSDHHLPRGAGYLHLRSVVDAVVGRARGATRRVHRVGQVEVDTVAREVRIAGTRVALRAMEFELLSALASDPERVFTKDELLRSVWGYRAPGRTRTLDSHACRLRLKLAEHGARAVVTVRGVGYRFGDAERPAR
jgi:DNA-binding response OmpR family regulator